LDMSQYVGAPGGDPTHCIFGIWKIFELKDEDESVLITPIDTLIPHLHRRSGNIIVQIAIHGVWRRESSFPMTIRIVENVVSIGIVGKDRCEVTNAGRRTGM
jgi:hypothetical protein